MQYLVHWKFEVGHLSKNSRRLWGATHRSRTKFLSVSEAEKDPKKTFRYRSSIAMLNKMQLTASSPLISVGDRKLVIWSHISYGMRFEGIPARSG